MLQLKNGLRSEPSHRNHGEIEIEIEIETGNYLIARRYPHPWPLHNVCMAARDLGSIRMSESVMPFGSNVADPRLRVQD